MKKKNVRRTLAGITALTILSGQLVTAAEVVNSVDVVPAEVYNENLDIAPETNEVINSVMPEPAPMPEPSAMPSANPMPEPTLMPMPSAMPSPPAYDIADPYRPVDPYDYTISDAFNAAKFRLGCIAEALYSDEELTEVYNEILDSLQSATSAYEIDSYVDSFISTSLKIAEERNEIETYKGIVFFKLDILREKYIANQNNSQAIEAVENIFLEGVDKLQEAQEITIINDILENVRNELEETKEYYELAAKAEAAELEEAKESSKKKIMEYAESASSDAIMSEAKFYCSDLRYARTVDEVNKIEEQAFAAMHQIYEEENNYDLIKVRYADSLKDILRRMKNPSDETIKFAENSIEKIMNAEDKETGKVIYDDAYSTLMMEYRAKLKAAREEAAGRITDYAESTGSDKVIAEAKEQVTYLDQASSIDSVSSIESSVLQNLREIYEDELPGATKWHIYQSIPAEQKMEITDDGVFHISVIESEGADHEKWDLRFRRKNLNFKKEHEYQISFKVKSKRDEMELTSKIGNIKGDEQYFVLDGDKGMVIGPSMGGDWGRALKLTTDWQEITGTFEPSRDVNDAEWAFEYAAGNQYEGNAVDGDEIWFKDIAIVCTNCDGTCLTEPAAVITPDSNVSQEPNATPAPVPELMPSSTPTPVPEPMPSSMPSAPPEEPTMIPPHEDPTEDYSVDIQNRKAEIILKIYYIIDEPMVSEADRTELEALIQITENAKTIDELQDIIIKLESIVNEIKSDNEIKEKELIIFRDEAIAKILETENSFWRITPDVKNIVAESTDKITVTKDTVEIEKITEEAISRLQELLKAEVLPVLVPAKEASHTEDGSRAYYTYEGRFYEDYDCTAEIKDIETWSVVAAEGHKFGSWKITVLPTSDHDGVKERSCEVCNEVEKTSTTFNKPAKTDSSISADESQEDTGAIQVVTKPESNAMSAEVDIKASDLVESLPLTIEEMTMIENGSVVSVAMTSNDITEQADPVEKQKVEEILAPEQKIAAVIDVTVEKFIDGAFTGNVTEFNSPITVAIEIPQELIKKDREFAIARVHNGEVQMLSLTQLEGTKFTFDSEMFSSYYIVYNDVHIEHTFTEWTTLRNASWKHSGLEIRTCTVDGVTETRVTQESKIERVAKAAVKLVKKIKKFFN